MIRPKVILKGKQFSEHARRYVLYPMGNLDFSGNQYMNPLWEMKYQRGRMTLLESVNYMVRGDDPDYEVHQVKQGLSPLIEKTQGTDAQINFLMGNSDGTGYMNQGMAYLESLTDVDPQTAMEVELKLYGVDKEEDITVPDNMVDLKRHLSRPIVGEDPITILAKKVQIEVLAGIERGMAWLFDTCLELEKELGEGQAGRPGIKSLSKTQRYYFEQIKRPLPEDRAGSNMGSELARVLQPLINQSQGTTSNFGAELELKQANQKIAEMTAQLKEQEEALNSIVSAEE